MKKSAAIALTIALGGLLATPGAQGLEVVPRGVAAQPPAPGAPKIVRKKTKLIVTVPAVKGATQYQARIRVAKNGSWSFWTTQASPKFTFTEIQSKSPAELIPLKSNTSYKIAIRVGADSGYGPKRVVVTSTK